MKEISVEQLHKDTGQSVRLAASRERILITDNGRPIAELTAIERSAAPGPLPNRVDRINACSRIMVDSTDYLPEMRG